MKRTYLLVSLLCLAVPGIASAHNFGTRTIAPAALNPSYNGADVGLTINDHRPYWRLDAATPGFARVFGSPLAHNWHYARISVEHDSEFSDGQLAFSLRANGGNDGTAGFCYGVYSISSSGTISAFAGSACTSGAAATDHVLVRNLPVASDSAVVVEMAGQNNAVVKYLKMTYD